MAKLIDLDELVGWLTSPTGFRTNCEDCNSTDCLNCIVEEGIKNQPIVEAAPAVHGHWIHIEDETHECSACGGWECFKFFDIRKYCPQCGAIMDEEVK